MTFARTFRRGDRVVHVDDRLKAGAFVRYVSHTCGQDAVVHYDGDGQVTAPVTVLRHAPVHVVGNRPPVLPTYCPWCGSTVTIDPEAVRVTPLPGHRPLLRRVRVAACDGCEHIQEC